MSLKPLASVEQEWVRERIKAVSAAYSAYDALSEMGMELGDRDMTVQIPCPLPGHGPDNKPSARYYAASGSKADHFFCFKCKENLNGIGLFARTHGMEFMRALSELERRFSIRIKRPEVSLMQIPPDKSGKYESAAWTDVPRLLNLLEDRLPRIRNRVAQLDFVKWCRVLDVVRWDFDHSGGKANPAMIAILMKLKGIMDSASGIDANI